MDGKSNYLLNGIEKLRLAIPKGDLESSIPRVFYLPSPEHCFGSVRIIKKFLPLFKAQQLESSSPTGSNAQTMIIMNIQSNEGILGGAATTNLLRSPYELSQIAIETFTEKLRYELSVVPQAESTLDNRGNGKISVVSVFCSSMIGSESSAPERRQLRPQKEDFRSVWQSLPPQKRQAYGQGACVVRVISPGPSTP